MSEQRKGMSLREWMRYLEEQEKAARGEAAKRTEGGQPAEHHAPPQSTLHPRPPWRGMARQHALPTVHRTHLPQPQQVRQAQQPVETNKPVEAATHASSRVAQGRSFWVGIKNPRSHNRLDELLKQILIQVARLQTEINRRADESPRWKLLSKLLDPDMSIRDVALLLDVCETTIRRYTNSGLLEHYRTSGNQRRFRLSHVLKFIMRFGSEGVAEGRS